ncbi:MAG: T9SS type A sorting domain-containing protein [Saprospiraceae bacterium]
MKILEIQQSPNVPLYAGEGSPTGTSNNAISSNKKIWVYPNPTSGVLYFKPGLDVENVEVFDLAGRFLGRFGVKDGSLDVCFLQPGCYFLRIGGRMVWILKE